MWLALSKLWLCLNGVVSTAVVLWLTGEALHRAGASTPETVAAVTVVLLVWILTFAAAATTVEMRYFDDARRGCVQRVRSEEQP